METLPKSARRLTTRKTDDPVPVVEEASGELASGTPVQPAPARAKREPLVTIQLGDRRELRAPGL